MSALLSRLKLLPVKLSLLKHWWRSWPGHVLKLVVSFTVVALLLYQTELNDVAVAISSARWGLVVAATWVVLLGVVVLQAYEIYLSLPVAMRPSLVQLARINLAMMCYAFFMPTGLTFAVRWAKYRALGLEGLHSAALVGVHKLLQLMVALAFFVVGYFAFPVATHPAVDTMMWGLLLLLAGLIAYFGWLGFHPRTPFTKGPAIVQKLLSVTLLFQRLPAGDKLRCLTLAVMQHLCIVTSAYWVLLAIEPDTPLLAVMMIRSLLVVLLVVPITVAGVGIRELVFFTLFPFYGVEAETALAASLVLLGIQLFVACLGALSELKQLVLSLKASLKVTK